VQLDIDQVEEIVKHLLKNKDFEPLEDVISQLEYLQQRIGVILYEVDQILEALVERDTYHDDNGKYDS
jgi:mevalonate kinase